MRVLVTGGGGFLGSHIARQLVARGHRVAVLGRHPYPGLDEGIECIQADICDSNAVNRALKGREAVFHAAAMAGIWGRPKDFYSINVEGTDNIIAGCVQNSVSKLIFTSSPSVVFGQSDMENVDESAPYPEVHLSQYSRTKALAERRVLQMNGHNGLMTVALRPHLIWGVGDPHLIPRVIERAKKGRLLRVGQGGNRVDLTHVENAAHAHVLACEAMEASSPIAGKCYFVSDDRPVDLWKWIDELLSALSLPAARRSLPLAAAKLIGGLLEGVYHNFNILSEPPMTRFLACQLATSHYFNISRAKKDFAYHPVVTPEEGLENLIQSYQADR